MNTDTKALATVGRYAFTPYGMSAAWAGSYVLFTDHERVVGELQEQAKQAFSVHDESLTQRQAEIRNLTEALAASRAEVEGLIEVAKVYLHGEYQDAEVEYSSEYRTRRYKEGQALAKAIDAAMEKGNV